MKAGAHSVWVIWNEKGELFVSSRSLAKVLGYAKAGNVVSQFQGRCHHVNRKDFPSSCRSEATDEKHVFFLFSGLHLVTTPAKQATLHHLWPFLVSNFVQTAYTWRDELSTLQRETSERRATGLSALRGAAQIEEGAGPEAPLSSIAVSTVLKLRPRPSCSFVLDVSVPPIPLSPLADDSAADVLGSFASPIEVLGDRHVLSFDFASEDPDDSLYRVRRSLAAPSRLSMTLRPDISASRAALAAQETAAEMQIAGVEESRIGDGHFGPDFVAMMHQKVLDAHDLQDWNAIELSHVRTAGIQTDRRYADIERMIYSLGHGVVSAAGETCHGKFCWFLLIRCGTLSDAPIRALRYFGRVKIVCMYSRGKESSRTWYLESRFLSKEDMAELEQELFVQPLKNPPPHADFRTQVCNYIRKESPWVQLSGTTLGNAAAPNLLSLLALDAPDSFVERSVIVSMSKLHELALRKPCCQKMQLTVQSCHGIDTVLKLTCTAHPDGNGSLRTMDGLVAEANRVAYAALLMSGRPAAVKRFLSWLGIGGANGIPDHGRYGSYLDAMFEAVEAVYLDASKALIKYSLASSKCTVSIDIAHKRMAKAGGQMGEALSNMTTFCDPRIGKVLYISFFLRRDAEQSRLDGDSDRIVCSPAIVGKLPVDTGLRGSEHSAFEIAIKRFQQITEELNEDLLRIFETIEGQLGECEMDVDDSEQRFRVEQIVVDALSSAPGSIARVFGDDVIKVFIDWWHRRTSAKKVIQKLEGEKNGDKTPKFPRFQGLKELIAASFSENLFAVRSFQDYRSEVEQLMCDSGMGLDDLDELHRTAFEKLMKDLAELYSKIDVNVGTSINERFHAHLRFYCLKGDSMTTQHWKILAMFAFLSFNNVPGWQSRVTARFLDILCGNE